MSRKTTALERYKQNQPYLHKHRRQNQVAHVTAMLQCFDADAPCVLIIMMHDALHAVRFMPCAHLLTVVQLMKTINFHFLFNPVAL